VDDELQPLGFSMQNNLEVLVRAYAVEIKFILPVKFFVSNCATNFVTQPLFYSIPQTGRIQNEESSA
jgi:hypothetical protein